MDTIYIPESLVLGCNNPVAVNALSDFVEEVTGSSLDIMQSGYSNEIFDSIMNIIIDDNDIEHIIGDGRETCYGDGCGDGHGDGYGIEIGYGNGDGCGCGYGHENGSGVGTGDERYWEEKY